jgi:23S rRNA (cytosine1962-C5)-methyltransferase
VVEDALKFVKREVKRGKKYNGIILDPPAYGRGPDGEKWVLEEGLTELLEQCSLLLAPKQSFLVLNLYSMGLSSVVSANLADAFFKPEKMEYGEFYLNSRSNQKLPLGTFLRFRK